MSEEKGNSAGAGQGERILEMEFDEEINPFLVVSYAGERESYEIGERLLIGKDPKKCKVVLDFPDIGEIHCLVGYKNEKVLVKSFVEDGVQVKRRPLPEGRTVIIEFGDKINIGKFIMEVSRSRPLDLEKVKPRKVWRADLKEEEEEEEENGYDYEEEDEIEKESFMEKLLYYLKHPWALFLGRPSMESDGEDEGGDDDDDITDIRDAADLQEEELEKIARKPFLVRIFSKLFYFTKEELSVFQTKEKSVRNERIDRLEEKLEAQQKAHFKKVKGVDDEMAEALVANGIEDLDDLRNLSAKELKKITGKDSDELEEVLEEAHNAIESGKLSSRSRSAGQIEGKIKEIERSSTVALDVPSGPIKRLGGQFLSFYLLYTAISEALNVPQIKVIFEEYGKKLTDLFIPLLTKSAKSADFALGKKELGIAEDIIPYFGVWIILQLIFHLAFSVTLGQWLLGLKTSGNLMAARIKGVIRYLIGLPLAPFIIFDLPLFFRKHTFKEIISTGDILRKPRPPIPEAITSLILLATIFHSLIIFYSSSREEVLALAKNPEAFVQRWKGKIEKLKKKILAKTEKEVFNLSSKKIRVGEIVKQDRPIEFYDLHGKKMKENATIYDFTELRTPEKAHTTLALVNNVTIQVIGKSRLVFFVFANKTPFVFVRQGRLRISGGDEDVLFLTELGQIVHEKGDFVLTHNKIGLTNVVVIDGAVSLVKKPQSIDHFFTLAPKRMDVLNEIENQESMYIGPAEFAALMKKLEKPTVTVRYAPAQYEKLSGKTWSFRPKVTLYPYGHLDISKNSFQPRIGGYIDLSTGHYIPPFDNAQSDKERGVFVIDSKLGSVDEKGDYLPPPGIKIHPVDGAIFAETETSPSIEAIEYQMFVNGTDFFMLATELKEANDLGLFSPDIQKRKEFNTQKGITRLDRRKRIF